jgi:poly(3-hydroxybutyrate) depolymerase
VGAAAARAQLGDPDTVPYEQLADQLGFVLVYPLGMDDSDPEGKDCGTGWNVVGGHGPHACDLETASSASCCYSSCQRLGVCSDDGIGASCGWSTCHDDVLFISMLLETLKASLPIAPAQISLTGASNGGMLL